MLLRLHKIPAEGMDLAFSIPALKVREGMAKKDPLAPMFDESVTCDLHLTPMRKDVFLEGEISTTLHPLCARCNDSFAYPFSGRLDLTVSPQPASDKKSSDSYQESDEGLIYYRNDELDLAEIVREQILLSLPMRFLCKENCLGLCQACGANLNLGPHTCKVRAHKRN